MPKNINHVSHIKSKQIVGGKPKLPEASSLIEGEIAINFAKDVETISTKNESGTVVTFSSDNYYTQQKLGSGFISENSGRTVTDALAEKVDKTTYNSFTAQTNTSIDDLSGQSETIAAAINNLDDRVNENHLLIEGKSDIDDVEEMEQTLTSAIIDIRSKMAENIALSALAEKVILLTERVAKLEERMNTLENK